MRVLYLHQYFVTPAMTGITRSYEMARRLVQAGHEVTVVTSHPGSSPHGESWSVTEEGGAEVHWLHEGMGPVGDQIDPVGASNKMSYGERIRSFLRFATLSTQRMISQEVDVIYFSSPPPTLLFPAWVSHARKGTPLVAEVRDLYPEVAIELGGLTNPVVIAVSKLVEQVRGSLSSHIVTASPEQRAGVIRRGMDPARVSVVPNSSDLELFQPGHDGHAFREKHHLGEGFLAVYFGKFGLSNGLDYILDAAAVLQRQGVRDVTIVMVGDGKEKPALEERVASEGLTNVRMLPPVSKQEVVAVAAAGDVALTIFHKSPVLQGCSPNKFFDALAAGRPVVTNLRGWVEGLVESNACGLFVSPEDPTELAEALLWMRDHPEERQVMGQNARKLGEREFSRDAVAAELERVLVAAGSSGSLA